jgi:C-terminal peptidase (prc)
MNDKKQTLVPVISAVALAVGIVLGFIINDISKSRIETGIFTSPATGKFDEVIKHIEKEYVDSVNRSELENDAVVAMMNDLDPHSQYISSEEFDAFNDPLLGSFEGIGVSFRIEKDTVTIINPVKGGPSEKVGIMAGDRIVRVGDFLIAGVGLKNENVMRLLKGPKNTKVNLKILRRGIDSLLDFTITRDIIPTYSVDIAYMLDDKIGYVKLSKFSATTHKEFVRAIRKLKGDGMEKLVFDLRGNSGGYLGAAVDVADEFLPKNSLIVYTEGKNRPRSYLTAQRKGLLEDIPVVVLIDGESASASEIVAGALQDNDRGTIVGRRSFGKGLVQEQIMLKDNSAIRLTVARYYTPTGRSIQKPFDGDREKYMYESIERFDNGELFDVDSVHFNDSLKYVTPKGKIVYGGGGIMPDIYVPMVNDSTEYFFNLIVNTGILFGYAFDYADMNRVKLNRFESVEAFDKGFQFTDAMFAELVKRAEKQGIKGTEAEKKVARKEAAVLFKAYVGRNLFDEEGFYPIYEPMDDILQRAVLELNK